MTRSSRVAARLLGEAIGQAVLLQLVDDVAAAGEIADEHALPVADELGRDVFVGGGILHDGADVDAAFVREGALADERLVFAQRQVGQFGDVAAGGSQRLQLVRTDGRVAEFQFEIGDDGREIRVAAALAVAVEAALHVRRALLDGGERVGHGDVGIVMGVDADDAVETRANIGDDLGEEIGQRAAVGIAEAEHIGAGVFRGFERAQGEIAVVDVAVEEMLGIVDDFLAVVFEIADGFGDDREVFVFGDAERAGDMEVPALAEDGDDRACRRRSAPDVAVFFDRSSSRSASIRRR